MEKTFTAINVLGLAMALWASLVISLWVLDEWKYDRFLTGGEHIYRVLMNFEIEGELLTEEATSYALGDALLQEFAEVENMTRYSYPETAALTINDKSVENELAAADPSFFNIFKLPFIEGDPATCLNELSSVVISQSLAKSYFPGESPLGEVISVHEGDASLNFTVTGVFQDFPEHSSNRFHLLIPIDNLKMLYTGMERWGNTWFATFLQMDPKTDLAAFNKKILNYAQEKGGIDWYTLFSQPYQDQYLYGEFQNGEQVGGRIDKVMIFLIVALGIVLIASANYVSMSVSRALKRAREIGIRKIIGASRWSIIGQLMVQASLIVTVAMIIGMSMTYFSLDLFNFLTGKQMYMDWQDLNFYFSLGIISIIAFGVSCIYPSFYMASLQSVRSRLESVTPGKMYFRKILLVGQFALSMILISGTYILYLQVDFLLSKDVGLSKENILIMDLDQHSKPHFEEIKTLLQTETSIAQVSGSSHDFIGAGVGFTADIKWRDQDTEGTSQFFGLQDIDHALPELLNIKLAAGRWFNPQLSSDSATFMVNRLAAQAMGMTDPIGEEIEAWHTRGKIIGVTENFHFTTLRESIKPIILRWNPNTNFVFVKTQPGQTAMAMRIIEKVHDQFSPLPITYHFMDDKMAENYQAEISFQRLSNFFSMLAIVISCLGLLGLILFHVSWKTKEIAIRKVLGAPLLKLVSWLFKDYLVLLIVATAIGIPLSILLIDQWLDNFVYRIDPSGFLFLIPAFGILTLCGAIIFFQTVKVNHLDPAQTLKDE